MIKYFLHDGRTFICPHYAGSSDLHQMLDFAREAGVDAMNKAGTQHAIYGVKKYDRESGLLIEADIYCPAVLLDDDEFYRRTEAEYREYPGCYILAAHAHK